MTHYYSRVSSDSLPCFSISHFSDQTYPLTKVFHRQRAGRGDVRGQRPQGPVPSQVGKATVLRQRTSLELRASKCSQVFVCDAILFSLAQEFTSTCGPLPREETARSCGSLITLSSCVYLGCCCRVINTKKELWGNDAGRGPKEHSPRWTLAAFYHTLSSARTIV